MTFDEKTLDRASMSIEQSLRRLGRQRLLDALRPGRTAVDVRQRLTAVGLSSAGAIEAFYGWHDGVQMPTDMVMDDLELLPGFFLLSLDEAVREHQARSSDNRWSNWLPLLADGAGSFYVADLAASDDPPVLRWEYDETEPNPLFTSIPRLFDTVATAFTERIIFVQGGYLETDQGEFERHCALAEAPDA